ASRRPLTELSEEESRSGISRPKTLSGPSARTARAAHTELSMPPDMATTKPRRRRCWRINSRTLSVMRVISASRSKDSKASIKVSMAGGMVDVPWVRMTVESGGWCKQRGGATQVSLRRARGRAGQGVEEIDLLRHLVKGQVLAAGALDVASELGQGWVVGCGDHAGAHDLAQQFVGQ